MSAVLKRESLRLRNYDYSAPGYYFVTICVQDGECLFGQINDRKMDLNEWGKVVETEWLKTAIIRPNVKLDRFVVMPNHFHAIISLINGRGTARRAPTDREQFGKPVIGSIPTIVRSFKSAVTKRINELRNLPARPVWQRNYYERVIRDEKELHEIRKYIENNPAEGDLDSENLKVGARRAVPLQELV